MRRAAVAAVLAAALLAPAAAGAHVQVRPATAAPEDPVLWTVLVPNERELATTRVELAVPAGVLPFSLEDQPGWRRSATRNADGSLRSIVWRGRTAPDGLATFRFLASTPDREGPIAWKALQTYADGDIVRWIGAAGSEYPASVTSVTGSAPRENAGGEGAAGTGSPAAGGGAEGRGASAPEAADSASASEADWVARGLALIAAVVGLGVGVIVVVRGRAGRGGRGERGQPSDEVPSSS